MGTFLKRYLAAILIISVLFESNAGIISALILPPMLSSIFRLYLQSGLPLRENVFSRNRYISNEYDFIIIGAGPGGSAMANRLTEIPEWDVLLLEAGSPESIYTDIPATVGFLQLSDYNWGYKAERTDGACLGMVDQRCPWPRGKAMGGSSAINYMVYSRGNRKDYDNFEKAGNVGWGYEDVLPYFLKSERNNIPEYQYSQYHSRSGYLDVERVPHRTQLVDGFLKAGLELGYDIVDYNEPEAIGFSRIQATMKNGRRCSASKAYIRPVRNRTNLHVSMMSRVQRILIDPASKTAYGVQFVKNGKTREVLARKEVIVSAGTLNTPQLLMLSGIGPKQHLEELGIATIENLPVGKNLRERYVTIGLSFITNTSRVSLTEKDLNVASLASWLTTGKGVLTLPGGVEGIAYVNTKYNNDTGYPDMEYLFSAGSLASDGGRTVRKCFGLTDRIYAEMFDGIGERDTWTIFPMLLHPKSTGEIKLRNADPETPPIFRFNYYGDRSDLKVMVEGLKGVIRLSETKAFQKLGTKLNPAVLPECSNYEMKSDKYWACFARYFTGTIHHQCGTCKMGPESDETAVVTPQLKVRNVKNLRVVDASIFPNIPSAHLYAPTLMVAEKAADMVKSEWLEQQEIGFTN